MTKPKGGKLSKEFWAALDRVLSHSEGHGEVYEGATKDHTTLRAAQSESPEAAKAVDDEDDDEGDEGEGDSADSTGSSRYGGSEN